VQIYEEDRRLTIRTEQKAVAHCWSTEGCSAMGGGGGGGEQPQTDICPVAPSPPPLWIFAEQDQMESGTSNPRVAPSLGMVPGFEPQGNEVCLLCTTGLCCMVVRG